MAKTIQFEISDLTELNQVVDFLRPYLLPHTIFLLNGDMASGKTTLISNLLQKINISQVSSPTYAIHQMYQSADFGVHHFDLHRLESIGDIESTGFWDFFTVKNNIFFVEWADQVPDHHWPIDFKIIQIFIKNKSDTIRLFEIQY